MIGLVQRPRIFSLAELRSMPHETQRLTLVCAASPLNARQWETRDWAGVPFLALLEATGVVLEARSVQAAGYDGAVRGYILDELRHALLAFEADGRALSAAQGYPARLLIPGRSACEMPRFVQRIAFRADEAAPFDALTPFAVIERVLPMADGARLEGLALGTDSVAVRLDDGPAVVVTLSGQADGVAGRWSLDWPGANAARARFSAEAMPLVPSPEARPLARRWRARRASWTPGRNPEP
ncbi:MAG: molybdopterin-dependent oxidoreductase [Anaerolineae bacterium]|nr:molybdopterin-dependent oxidoreductase [Anaerolineae bacterium]